MDTLEYIYFGSIFATTVIFVLIALLLFLQRKRGERSRMILMGITLLSALNYIRLVVDFQLYSSYNVDSVMQVPFLFIGIFVIAIYVVYPIEVISPGWLNWKRLVKIYIPFILILLFYCFTLWLGVEYTSYKTVGEMMEDIGSFQVIFRIVLALLIFLPALLLYYVPYTRRYNNTDNKWIRGYIMAVVINMVAYLIVNTCDTFLVCSLYVAVSVFCSLYITYQELYVRLIRCPIELQPTDDDHCELYGIVDSVTELDVIAGADSRRGLLFDRLEEYMNSKQAWRDPDLSAIKLSRELHTNRTSLREAIQQHNFSGYTSYVNSKRIDEFINVIEQNNGFNYQQTFFDVGFRSKTTALRNFKEITGMIPSEYFRKINK